MDEEYGLRLRGHCNGIQAFRGLVMTDQPASYMVNNNTCLTLYVVCLGRAGVPGATGQPGTSGRSGTRGTKGNKGEFSPRGSTEAVEPMVHSLLH